MKVLIVFCIILFFASIGFFAGAEVPVRSQLELVDVIVSFSSFVFAILGLWLAVVFPEIMAGIYKKRSSGDKKKLVSRAKRLLLPLCLASMVAASGILVRIAAEPIMKFAWLSGETFDNSILFAFITVSFFILVVSLILALAPGIQMVFDGSDEVKKAERDDRYFKQSQNNDE
jgi:uncharacterized protein YacL